MNASPSTSGVYVMRCTATGRAYVGSSTNIRSRMYHHWGSLKRGDHENKELQAEYDEHGRQAFTVETVRLCPPEERKVHEQYEIVHALRAGVRLYNIRSASQVAVTTMAEVMAAMEAW